MNSNDDVEHYLRERIRQLHSEYQQAIEPYMRKLVQIEAMRAPRPMLVDLTALNPEILKMMQENNKGETE